MSLADRASELLGGDILMRLRADATGLDADLSSKLTAAERTAEVSARRIGATSTEAVAATEKVQVAQLRAAAAQERYNAALTATNRNTARIATAEAALISARGRQRAAEAEQLSVQQRAATASATSARGISLLGGAGIVAATVAAQRLFAMYREGVKSAEDLQVANAQTTTELAATGNAAGVTAEHVHALAEEMAHTSGVQDTVIQGAENLLLQYTAIRNAGPDKIFDRAAKAAEDLAVAYAHAHGGSVDVAMQAQALGVALQDPARGLDRLRRAGIAFTAQQRDQIKALADSGHVVQAQALMLDYVNQKVGGSAEAFGRSAAGAAGRAQVAYEELSRQMTTNLLPVVTHVEEIFSAVFSHRRLAEAAVDIGLVGTGVGALVAAERALQTLRKSELLSIAARLLPYRSLARAQEQLAAAEDRHAEAATRAAAAERTLSASTAGSAAATEAGTAAQAGRTDVLAEMALLRATIPARRSAGALARAGLLTAGRVAGAIGLADLVAEPVGHLFGSGGIATAFRLGQGLQLNDRIRQLYGSTYANAFPGQKAAVDALRPEVIRALNDAQAGHFDALKSAILDVQRAYRDTTPVLDSYVNEVEAEARGHGKLVVALDAEAVARQRATSRIDAARAAYARAAAGVRSARAEVAAVRAGDANAIKAVTAGGADLVALGFPAQETVDTTSTRLAAASAAASRQSALDSVARAEAHLTTVRSTAGHTAAELAAAERSLALAKQRAAIASDRAAAAEKRSNDARDKTALSAQDIVKRFAQSTEQASARAVAEQRLAHRGIGRIILDQLEQVDAQAPGTLAELAHHITKAQIAALRADQSEYAAAQRRRDVALAQADLTDAKNAYEARGRALAKAVAHGYAVGAQVDMPAAVRAGDRAGLTPAPGRPVPGAFAPINPRAGTPNLSFNFYGPTTFTDPKQAVRDTQTRRRRALAGATL